MADVQLPVRYFSRKNREASQVREGGRHRASCGDGIQVEVEDIAHWIGKNGKTSPLRWHTSTDQWRSIIFVNRWLTFGRDPTGPGPTRGGAGEHDPIENMVNVFDRPGVAEIGGYGHFARVSIVGSQHIEPWPIGDGRNSPACGVAGLLGQYAPSGSAVHASCDAVVIGSVAAVTQPMQVVLEGNGTDFRSVTEVGVEKLVVGTIARKTHDTASIGAAPHRVTDCVREITPRVQNLILIGLVARYGRAVPGFAIIAALAVGLSVLGEPVLTIGKTVQGDPARRMIEFFGPSDSAIHGFVKCPATTAAVIIGRNPSSKRIHCHDLKTDGTRRRRDRVRRPSLASIGGAEYPGGVRGGYYVKVAGCSGPHDVVADGRDGVDALIGR